MSCDPCNQSPICSDDIIYSGPNLVCTTIGTCDSMSTAFQKLNSTICSLQSTLVILQNQLNSYTTTTTTSSTSTTSTTSTSSSTTTTTTLSTWGSFFVIWKNRFFNVPTQLYMMFRLNGGAWTRWTSTSAPAPNGLFNIGISYPQVYGNIGQLSTSVITPVLGDFMEVYFVRNSDAQNVRFGVGFTVPSAGSYSTYCGSANPYGFFLNKINYYFNIDVTGDDSTWLTNTVVTC